MRSSRLLVAVSALTSACTLDPVHVLEPPDRCSRELDQGELALPASTASDAFGAGVRLNYLDTPYADLANIEQRLVELGAHHVNDTDTTDLDALVQLEATGFGLQLFEQEHTPAELIPTLGAGLEAYQLATRERVEAERARLPAGSAPALGTQFLSLDEWQALEGTALDFRATEVFPGTERPEAALQRVLGASVAEGVPPTWITQAGYATIPAAEGGVSATVQARYLLRLLLDGLRRGAQRIYVGQLADWGVGGGLDGSLGLLDGTGAPKPAFDMMAAWLRALADAAPPAEVGALDLRVDDAEISHLVFQRSDGTFLLALWLAVDSVDAETTRSVVVDLSTPIAEAVMLRPDLSPLPQARVASPSSLELEVSDVPQLIELVPACVVGD